MVDIIDKLKNLAVLLESKISENDAKAKELSVQLDIAKTLSIRNDAKAEELIAREKALDHIENVVKVEKESKERLAEANNVKADNYRVTQEISKEKSALLEKDESLGKLIALYKSKNASLEAEKVQLEADRKAMRIKILDELKGLK